MAKHIIYSTLVSNEEDWIEGYEDYLRVNDLTEDDCSLYEYIQDDIDNWFDCECANLSERVGDIIAIADLGLWDGHHKGYKVYRDANLNHILYCGRDINDIEVYCDRYNVIAEHYHHDGCNVIEYRLIKPGVNIYKLTDAIYNETVTRDMIRRYTKSLKPNVCKVYGWR